MQRGAESEQFKGGGGDLLVAAAGALVFALNIAPTAEPILLAAQLDGVRLGLVVMASLVLPYLMVFFAEFGGREQRVTSDGAAQGPVTETLVAYLVAFVVSAAMLAMFGRVDTRERRRDGATSHAGVPSLDRCGAREVAHMTRKRASGRHQAETPLEWALLLVSLAATLAVVVGLLVSGLAGPRGPADLRMNIADAG